MITSTHFAWKTDDSMENAWRNRRPQERRITPTCFPASRRNSTGKGGVLSCVSKSSDRGEFEVHKNEFKKKFSYKNIAEQRRYADLVRSSSSVIRTQYRLHLAQSQSQPYYKKNVFGINNYLTIIPRARISLGGRRSKGKGKGIRAQDHARGRR